MRGIDTQVRKTRRAIFREVANMAYHSVNLVDDMESLPYKLADAESSPYIENVKLFESEPALLWECRCGRKMSRYPSARV